MLEQEVAAKLVSGMPYFRYLAVRLGLGNVSLAKQSAWSTFVMARNVEIMWGSRHGISAPGDVGQTDALMEKVETKLQKAVEKIQHAGKKDITKLQNALITTNTEIAQYKMAVNNDMSEMKQAVDIDMSRMKEAVENISTTMSSLLITLEPKLITNMNLNLAIHADVITAKMDQFLSSTLEQPVPTTTTVPIEPSDHCDLQVLLRLRNATPISDNLVSCALGIHRKFTAGEPTDLVSRAVTRGLSSSTPFIVAVAGFSSGGKSFNMFSVGGILETILCHLPDVETTVKEVLTGANYLCGFQHSTGASATNICNEISRLRTTRPTPANTISSRSHMVVSLEDHKSGRLYGVLLDLAGVEESSDRALMNDEKVVSDTIALNNSDWRMMISELATPVKGLGGLVRSGARNFKRVSKINMEVLHFLVSMAGKKAGGQQGGMPAIRVLHCVNGSCDAVVTKSLNLIKELDDQAK